MSHQFSQEEKEVREFNNNYFPYGTTRVQVISAKALTTEKNQEVVDVYVVDPENAEITDTVRFFFVGGAPNISFNALREIFIHNIPENDKVAKGELFDTVKDTEALADLMDVEISGGEAWFTKTVDPARTYVGKDGETRQSVNRNLYAYPRKVKPEEMPKPKADQQPLRAEDYKGDDVPFGDTKPKTDAGAPKVPDNWS